MKKLISYKEYISESVKDLMKGKSDKEIEKQLSVISSPNEMLIKSAIDGVLYGVKLSLEKGADIHYRNESALGFASKNGFLDIVDYLLKNGADVHGWYDYAIKWATTNGHYDVVKLLIENGATVDSGNGDPLFRAFIHDDKKLIKLLLDNGAIIEEALCQLCSNGDDKIITVLFEKIFKEYPNIDIHYKNDLMIKNAALYELSGVLKLFLKYGADINDIEKYIKEYKEEINIYNESVKNLMKGKSDDEVKKSLYEYFKDDKVINFPDVIKNMNFLDLNNLYLIQDYERYYETIHKYLKKIVRDKESEMFNYKNEEYICFSEEKIVYSYDNTPRYMWYFDGKYLDKIIDLIIKNMFYKK